jgi:outer membrane protein TolC
MVRLQKMPLRGTVIICYTFFLFYNSAYAVTLEQCKTAALCNSKLLEAYENLIESSIYANRKDKSLLLPQISGFYQPDYVQYGPKADFAHHGYRNKAGIALSLDIPKILADYPQLSNLEIEKSKLIMKIAESEILKRVTQDYYQLYVLLKKKSYYVDAQSYINDHIKDIEALQSKGVDVKLDLIRAEVQLRSLYISRSNINQDIANVLVSLNSIMNTEYKESDFSTMDAPDMLAIQTDHTVFDKNAPEAEAKTSYIECMEKILQQKLANLEQSRLDEFDVKLAEEQYRQSKYSYLPSLEGGYEHNSHTIDPAIETDRAFLSLNFYIFDFGQKTNEEEQMKYAYESQKRFFNENQRKLKIQIDQLITQIENIQTTYKNASENLQNAEKALDTAKDYYQQGKIKETDLLNIFSEYMNAKDQSYDSLYDFFFKKAELDSLTRGMEDEKTG